MKKNVTTKKSAPKQSVRRKIATNVKQKQTTTRPSAAVPEAVPVEIEQPTTATTQAATAAPAAAKQAKASKKNTLITLLRREEGATLNELMTTTCWQAHSVRGFISGTLRKKLGLTIERVKRNETEASYRITA